MKMGMPEIDRMIAEVHSAAVAKYGADAVARVAASTLPNFEPTNLSNERQRPTWIHTPGLAARPWWSREQCGRLTEMITAFEAATAQIRAELVGIDPSLMGIAYDHLSVDPEMIRGWKNLFFFRDYKADEALLAKVPTIKGLVDRFGPEQLDRFELFLSVLEPGTHIPSHFGGANVKLTLHLPLWIPEGDCALRVDDDTRGWKDGEMMIFDDTFSHEAWNRTSKPRAVLLLKVYHPELSVEEVGVLEMFAPLNAKVYRGKLKEMGRGM
ncbi:Aspartyl/asparaginyl beta-hydroxylase [Minicystis rosea]|nr:Aspartyl/asparaginyl beta-hydroxylase [Minicystis rosea]